ncbi:hypothetical protein [Streptomyces sp. UNOC14_S4]|uniref:hypothetical protein n=1 Tax=Streptomyces sp. UNOC14_S4 TaxID=2872340 RepID=UPI001E28A23C|nr:hypothetical protein [Streptomyces sp. UNOC14_S4]MCC3766710.1 hypothetical protein [Streptomyces sp. UNOC14_S4]
MRTRCVRLATLSTRRHVLAFLTDPAATVLLTPTSAFALGCLQRSESVEEARELFVSKTAGKLADAVGTFGKHLQALCSLGIVESRQ